MDRDWLVISIQQTGFNVEPPERVTLTQKPHFINACRYIPGKFRCANDCFLEMCLRILSPLIPDTGTSELIYLLKETERAYNVIWYMYMNLTMSVNSGYQLYLVHERVWSFVSEKCHSFKSTDVNAQFSEMFSTKVFGQLSDQQASALTSVHYLSGQCNNCNNCVDSKVEIFLNYVTLSDLTRQDIPSFKWPDLLFHNNNQRTIQYTTCPETCRSNSSTSHLSEVLLIKCVLLEHDTKNGNI